MPPGRNAKTGKTSIKGGNVTWKWDDDLGPNLTKSLTLVEPHVHAVLTHDSVESQNDMRSNAPWTDRTGNARGGLFAQAYHENGEHGEVLYHTMPYGLWLELANSGKYRVIWPSTLRAGRRVMRGLRLLFRSL